MPLRAGQSPPKNRTTVSYVTVKGRRRNATILIRPGTAPTIGTTTTSTTGGSLGTGLSHNYKVTAMVGNLESLPSAVSNTVVTGAGTTNSNTVNWTPVGGATGYRVYGRTTSNWLLIATVPGQASSSYVDTGAITPAGLIPDATNLALDLQSSPGQIINAVPLATAMHGQTNVYTNR
jgi:hypothetical protein